MIEPQKKHAVAIVMTSPRYRYISFDCDPGLERAFERFGKVLADERASTYGLFVDGRYDFDEVADYMRSYESPIEVPKAFEDALGGE